MNPAIFSCLLCILSVLTASHAIAEDSPEKPSASPADKWRASLSSYTVRVGSKQPTMQPAPILSWSNAREFNISGATFVWTLDQRPVLISSAFNYRIRDRFRTKHTLHSLAKESMTVSDASGEFWHTEEPGITWVRHELPVSPNRKRDMLSFRKIAREFELDMRSHRDQTSRLRLMTSPLYQYQNDSVSGAIFSFASGTDPDALLLIEARRDSEDAGNFFAFARSHYYGLKANRKGDLVWEAPLDLEQQVQYLRFARRPLTAKYLSLIVEEKMADESNSE